MNHQTFDIAVVLPCYNDTAGLLKSLKSIEAKYALAVIVIDDGSANPPAQEELREVLPAHISLYYLLNGDNRGIEDSLNRGLVFAKDELAATYIARLDAGDTCHPNRFNTQKEFLDAHADITLVGSWVNEVDMAGKHLYVFSTPTEHAQIAKEMYWKNCFIHPAVMFKASSINELGLYSKAYKAAEDYEYFFRFVKFQRVAILGQVLLTKELNPNSISLLKRRDQLNSRVKIILKYFTFQPMAILGLLKNIAFLITPYSLLVWVKKRLYK